jgi:hypothetical protein
MREALMAKFTQRKELRAALLATSGKLLVEHTSKDSYLADCRERRERERAKRERGREGKERERRERERREREKGEREEGEREREEGEITL